MKIGICGNINIEEIAIELDTLLPDNEFIVGDIGAYLNELIEPNTEFKNLDFCILAIDWKIELKETYSFGITDNYHDTVKSINDNFKILSDSIKKLQKISSTRILIFSPIIDWNMSLGFSSRITTPSPLMLQYELQNKFNDFCKNLQNVFPIDMEEISSKIGKENAFDSQNYYTKNQPYSNIMLKEIATYIESVFIQFNTVQKKCLVLDLDNTLWGGIIGEDDIDNIKLGNFGLGLCYKNFQSYILQLYKQGIIIAICSKNNTCDALEVMEKHPHMILRPNVISAFRISWENKPDMIAEIAKELNILEESIVFIDDSKFEREMVKNILPDVTVLDMPDSPFLFEKTLRSYTGFWPINVTSEDIFRGEFYAKERLRKNKEKQAKNLEEYLESCNITAEFKESDLEDLPRVTQLLNKTNQFNLTTIRYTLGDIEKIFNDSQNSIVHISLNDNTTNYGIIAVAILKKNKIENFVLSCRAFGKKVEFSFLNQIVNFLRNKNYKELFAKYIPSKKNIMTKDFYKNAGFDIVFDDYKKTEFRLPNDKNLNSVPKWINIQ